MRSIFSKIKDFGSLNKSVDSDYEYVEVDGEEYRNLYQEEHPQPSLLEVSRRSSKLQNRYTIRLQPALSRDTLASNITSKKRRLLLISSITSTTFLLGVTLLSSNYLSHTNRDFGTKVMLFCTGISTAASIHLFSKEVNRSRVQKKSLDDAIHADTISAIVHRKDELSEKTQDLVKQDAEPLVLSQSDSSSTVRVFEPKTFEEIPQVIRALREGSSIILNLNVIDPNNAQRAVDFVAGGTYFADGRQERIGESIFLFAPSDVQVQTSKGIEKAQASNSASESDTTEGRSSRPKLILVDFNRPEESETLTESKDMGGSGDVTTSQKY